MLLLLTFPEMCQSHPDNFNSDLLNLLPVQESLPGLIHYHAKLNDSNKVPLPTVLASPFSL